MTGRIYLIGFMGAGKSTVAQLLADLLGYQAVDLDDEVERATGETVRHIFETRGEQAFRDLESERLGFVSKADRVVVACGGGVILRDENRAILSSTGTVVYLKVSADEAIGRIGDVASRPLLAGPSGLLAATTLLSAREGLYEAVAKHVVDTSHKTPGEVALAIFELVRDESCSSTGKAGA